jgi:four helix bundle protein
MENSYYKNLKIWQSSMQLAKNLYEVTKQFPSEEKFGLISQLRRAVVSIPSNIAEGYCRSGQKEKVHFLSISIGSLAEVETQIILSQELGYIDKTISETLLEQVISIQKQTVSLRTKMLYDQRTKK